MSRLPTTTVVIEPLGISDKFSLAWRIPLLGGSYPFLQFELPSTYFSGQSSVVQPILLHYVCRIMKSLGFTGVKNLHLAI